MKHYQKKLGILSFILFAIICFGLIYRHYLAVKEFNEHKKQWQELTLHSQECLDRGDFIKAELFCDEAIKIAHYFNPKDTCLSRSQIRIAEIYMIEKKFDLSEHFYSEAVSDCGKVWGPNSEKMIVPLENLANFYFLIQKRYDKMVAIYQQLLTISVNSCSHSDAQVIRRTFDLAKVYQQMKQYEQAELLHKKSLLMIQSNKEDASEYLLEVADFYLDWGKCDQAETFAKQSLSVREKAKGTDAKMDLAKCLYRFAEIYSCCHKPGQAESLYGKSLEIIENVLGKGNTDLTKPLIGLAKAFLDEGKYQQSEINFKSALALAEKNLGPGTQEVSAIVNDYCLALIKMKMPEKAKVLLRDQKWKELMYNSAHALKMNKPDDAKLLCDQAMVLADSFGPKQAYISKNLTWKAEIYRSEGKLALAEKLFSNAVSSCERAVGPNSPELISSLESQANFYYYTRINYKLVAQLYRRILGLAQHAPKPDYADVASRARNLADVYCLTDNPAEAERMYKLALKSAESAVGFDPNMIVQFLLALADFYRDQAKYELAETFGKKALEIREKTTGLDAKLDIAFCLNGLGKIYLEWGKPEKAELFYRQALDIVQKLPGIDNFEVTPYLKGLAMALHHQGRWTDAEIIYKHVLEVSGKNLKDNSSEMEDLLNNYATLLTSMKKTEEAKIITERIADIRSKKGK